MKFTRTLVGAAIALTSTQASVAFAEEGQSSRVMEEMPKIHTGDDGDSSRRRA